MPAVTADDAERLAEVRALDLEALKPTIERVTRLARTLSGGPIAYAAIIDECDVWHSEVGDEPPGRLPLERSPVAGVLATGEPLWVEDARATSPNHPWVAAAPFFRFYCAVPLRLSNGATLGGLCVGAPEPRVRDQALIESLSDLATLLGDEIERQRAEQAAAAARNAARTSEALIEAIVNAAPLALATVDRDLRFIQVNDRWTVDMGVAREDALGRTIPELFPDAYERMKGAYPRCMAGETVRSDRSRVAFPNGRRHWARVDLAPWRDADGEIGGMLMMSYDISDMIASLDRAERSERRLQMALSIADVVVYEVDYRKKTLQIDGAQDTFFDGTITYDSIGGDVWKTVHPEDRDYAMGLWDQHMRAGTPFRAEYRMLAPDGAGEPMWAASAAEVIIGADGRVERLLGTLKNITERRLAEEAVMAARDAAESANRAKSEFLANMSHEIRTPLNGVMGVASALARTTLSEQQTEMVGLIESSAKTLETLLSDVLDLARIESGRLELKPEPFDLAACARSVAALFEPGARAKGLDFGLDIDASAAGIFTGDAPRIRQILSNLLSNAVKFTSQGQVTLAARGAPAARGRRRLSLTVTDSGIGFDEETRARLFRRFEQADGSITRRFGGTGLGLAISLSLAQAMGGALEAVSSPGAGAAFTLYLDLPLADAADLPPASDGTVELFAAEGRAVRVLLAEDHPVNRRVVQLILEAAGVELTCVEDGAQAVEEAARGGYDLILMDMQMPVMDGLTAIGLIRAAEAAAKVPPVAIHALSANAMPEHIAASLSAGADGHLTKPINADALLAVVDRAANSPAPAPQRAAG